MEGLSKQVRFSRKIYRSLNLGLAMAILGFSLLVDPVEVSPVTISPLASDDEVCTTKVCNETVTSLFDHMDKNVDPCDNFYEYACGNFLNNAKIQDGETVNNMNIIDQEITKQLNQSLANITSSEPDKKRLKLLKKFYQSCMDTDKIDKIGISEVAEIIRSLGGWPVVDGTSWNETGFDWVKAEYKSHIGYYTHAFFRVYVDSYPGNFSKYVIKIETPRFDAPPKDLMESIKNKMMTAYLKYYTAIAEAFGASKDRAIDEMTDVINMTFTLFDIAFNSSNPKTMKISELEKEFPSIPWLKFINADIPAHLAFHEDENVTLSNPEYISKLLSMLERKPKRTVANYFMIGVVSSLVPFLNNELLSHLEAYDNAGFGDITQSERWKICTDYTRAYLSRAINDLYIQEHFVQETQSINEVRDMVRHVKEKFVDMIQKNDWMDDISKTYSLAKLATMSTIIGHLKEFNHEVDEYYKEFELLEDSFLKLALALKKFNHKKYIESYREPNEYKWSLFSDVARVHFYYTYYNDLFVSAATLHGAFFNKDRPKYVNYGSLGSIVGHEIAHAFDPQILNNKIDATYFHVFSKESRDAYDSRIKCIVDQYSNYTVQEVGLKIDGNRTRNENFADIVGMKAAYHAYKQWVEEHEEEKSLPQINRSPNQLFWLSFANMLCTKYPSWSAIRYIDSNDHTHAEARVMLLLKNMPEFAEDYHCPSGSNMNPSKRCQLF